MPEHTRTQKRERARGLFLTGECTTNVDIARRIGIKAHTVARYRRIERWDDLRRKIDRVAAEKLVETLAGERVNLNLRHYKYWDLLLGHMGTLFKDAPSLGLRELERLASIIERAQKGQRLARGLSLTGETEEQIRAHAQAESRALVDAFVEAVVENVGDEAARDRIRLAVLRHFPASDDADSGETATS